MRRNLLFVVLTLVSAMQLRGELQVLAITSSADYSQGALYPGSLATVFCTGLKGISSLQTPTSVPLPTTLSGVRVSFSGSDAPILALADYGTDQQINLQIPWGTMTQAEAIFEALPVKAFTLSQDGISTSYQIPDSSEWPVFFADVKGYAIAQHAQDFRPVTADNPTTLDEWIVLYATNLGPVMNQPNIGAAADANPLSAIRPETLDPYYFRFGPSIFLSSSQTELLESNYVGLAPGFAGVYQVNLKVSGELSRVKTVWMVYERNCGFIFMGGCGRGYTAAKVSVPVKLH